MIKRLFDLLFVVIFLPVWIPLTLLLALFVRIKLGEPVLFKLIRPSLHVEPFMY